MRILALLLALACPGAYAQTPEELAREYHAIVFAAQREAIVEDALRDALARRPALAPHRAVVREWLASLIDSREYADTMVRTYLELLGPDELRNLVANARLPAYHQYMIDQPLLDHVKADRTRALVQSREEQWLRRLGQAPYAPPAAAGSDSAAEAPRSR